MLPARPFYLTRHGQSEANVTHITAGGQFDTPLTELGRVQGQTLAPYLTQLAIKPGTIYHSTMQRARDTARYLNANLNLPIIEVHDLREHDMGAWDGKPWTETLPLLRRGDKPDGGESVSMFAQRVQSTLTDLLIREQANPPLLVCHGGYFHAIGFLYEYAMADVQNCHLHYFEPASTGDTFPWRVWKFDIEGERLVRSEAPLYLSRALNHIS